MHNRVVIGGLLTGLAGRYTGEWCEGQPHGSGEHTWLETAQRDGMVNNRYSGEFDMGARHGKGAGMNISMHLLTLVLPQDRFSIATTLCTKANGRKMKSTAPEFGGSTMETRWRRILCTIVF